MIGLILWLVVGIGGCIGLLLGITDGEGLSKDWPLWAELSVAVFAGSIVGVFIWAMIESDEVEPSSSSMNTSKAYLGASVLQRQQMKQELEEVNEQLDEINDSFEG